MTGDQTQPLDTDLVQQVQEHDGINTSKSKWWHIYLAKEGYSLPRLFITIYVLATGTFIVLALFSNYVISGASKRAADDYTRRLMGGTISLIEEELLKHPKSTREAHLAMLQQRFDFPIKIKNRADLNVDGSSYKVLKGRGLLIEEGNILLRTIGDTDQILLIGPIKAEFNLERMNYEDIPLGLRIKTFSWTLIGLSFAVALWFWLLPFWRDLELLRRTALLLGEGYLDSRASSVRNQFFRPLAGTMNQMAERIQQLVNTQRTLAGTISHELRTPIARLRFALALQGQEKDSKQLTQDMERDLDELDHLIDSSLTYARFERETPPLTLEAVDLLDWIKQQVRLLHILPEALKIQIESNPRVNENEIVIDCKLMRYALNNLLHNALKFADTQIVIRMAIDQHQAVIHIDDDGPGVSDDDKQHIFEPFRRLEKQEDQHIGYGLGLAIVKRVMSYHQGDVSVGVSSLGGARFSLSWPLHFKKRDSA